jgi:hypothetical protein
VKIKLSFLNKKWTVKIKLKTFKTKNNIKIQKHQHKITQKPIQLNKKHYTTKKASSTKKETVSFHSRPKHLMTLALSKLSSISSSLSTQCAVSKITRRTAIIAQQNPFIHFSGRRAACQHECSTGAIARPFSTVVQTLRSKKHFAESCEAATVRAFGSRCSRVVKLFAVCVGVDFGCKEWVCLGVIFVEILRQKILG